MCNRYFTIIQYVIVTQYFMYESISSFLIVSRSLNFLRDLCWYNSRCVGCYCSIDPSSWISFGWTRISLCLFCWRRAWTAFTWVNQCVGLPQNCNLILLDIHRTVIWSFFHGFSCDTGILLSLRFTGLNKLFRMANLLNNQRMFSSFHYLLIRQN